MTSTACVPFAILLRDLLRRGRPALSRVSRPGGNRRECGRFRAKLVEKLLRHLRRSAAVSLGARTTGVLPQRRLPGHSRGFPAAPFTPRGVEIPAWRSSDHRTQRDAAVGCRRKGRDRRGTTRCLGRRAEGSEHAVAQQPMDTSDGKQSRYSPDRTRSGDRGDPPGGVRRPTARKALRQSNQLLDEHGVLMR